MGAQLPGKSSIYAYSIYVSVGLLPWVAFANSISRATSVFLDKKPLISKIPLSLPSLLIYIILSETITFIIAIVFFFGFLFFTGYNFNSNLMLLPYIYFLQQLFAFGFGLLAATFTVFIRDLKEIIGIVLQFWFWFTPIVYVREILPEAVKKIIMYNPAYIIIEAYQRIFVFNDAPSYKSLITLTILTHCLIFIAYVLFRRLEKDVRDFI
jgi:lipopolysaccharide transport system permease protein